MTLTNSTMSTVPLIWSNDDIGYGLAPQLQRQLDFIDRFGIKGVFFVIPRSIDHDKGVDEDPALLRVIDQARADGHEFYQHGYVHDAFESGVPETWMLDLGPAAKRRYDVQRLAIEQHHTLDAMVRMLDNGRRIWRRALGEDSPGYRPGWLSFCGNLFRALAVLGYDWCSWRVPCPTSWLWNNGQWDLPMDFRADVPAHPTQEHGLTHYIAGGDYAFRVPHETDKIDAMVDLAMREMRHYHAHGWPFIICLHWHGLANFNDSGYAVHDKLLTQLLSSGQLQPMGMADLHHAVVQSRLSPSSADAAQP